MLRMGGFDGEGVQSGAVLVVKTHSPTPLWTKVKGQLEFNSKVSPSLYLYVHEVILYVVESNLCLIIISGSALL